MFTLWLLVQDDIEKFGDIASLDDNIEQFLNGDGRELYGALRQSPKEPSKGVIP